tara:strand:- start:975 stop:4649 length:3675 start_codon:yes stop_codon:yes gene_type:complete
MNLQLRSPNELEIKIEGNYYPSDRLVEVLNITYTIAGGSGDYTVEVVDEDSSNNHTSVIDSILGSCVIQLAQDKQDFEQGRTEIDGSIDLLVTDNDTNVSENIDLPFKFVIENTGTFQETLPLKADYTNLNVATSFSRAEPNPISRKANLVVSSSGGSGDSRVLWDVKDFEHPNITILTPNAAVQKIISLQFDLPETDIPSEILENPSTNDYVLSGNFNFTLIDNVTDEFVNDSVDWSFKVTVLALKDETDFRTVSRVVPGRFRVRNPDDNSWLDMCYDEMYIYDTQRNNWLRLFPGKVFVRDANNIDWVAITCVFDETYDDPCSSITGDDCVGRVNDPFAGSGDGKGSAGPNFDLIRGYPPGYDLPDSFLGGFGVKTAGTSYDSRFLQTGFIIQRPGILNQETYDYTGINQDDDNLGTWNNPNVLGASTWSRGAAVTEMIYELGQDDGWFELCYAAYDSVSIDVYFLGERVATTCGQVPSSTRGPLSFFLALGKANGHNKVLVRVRGKERCSWAIQITGPTASQVFPEYDPYDSDLYGDIQSGVFNEPDLTRMHYLGTPALPAPCRATVGNIDIGRALTFPLHQRIDSRNFFEFYHFAGSSQGTLHLDYTSWQNADKIEVYHDGRRIASNYEVKQIAGTIAIPYDPTETKVHDIVVRVYTKTLQKGDPLKTWYYSLYCIDEPGYRDMPWDCSPEEGASSTANLTRDNKVSSMGNYCMEDNINIDNGLNQGVFKIRFLDSSTKCRVTLFNEDGSVIPSYDPVTDSLLTTREIEGFSELDYFNFDQDTAQTFKKIAVRVESDLASTWEYQVTCPVPLLDIILDPIDVASGISIEDTFVLAGSSSGSTWVVAEAPVNNDVIVEYTMVDGTATNLNDYCAVTSSVTIPAGSDRVELPFSLAPCDDIPVPPSGGDWVTRPFKIVTDHAKNYYDDSVAGIYVGSNLPRHHAPDTTNFAGMKNHSPPRDDIVFESEPNDKPIEQFINSMYRYAYSEVEATGLKEWRISQISGADANISINGWTSNTVSASLSTDSGVSEDEAFKKCVVQVEFKYNDGTILSQQVTLVSSAFSDSRGGGGGCPSYNTPITLLDKTKILAGEVKEGTELLGSYYGGDSLDWTAKDAELRLAKVIVTNVEIFEADHYVVVNSYQYTENHPFFVNRKGKWLWVEAGNLVMSDLILDSDYELATIDTLKKVSGTLKFVRIDVSNPDTYFAGNLLCHNKEFFERSL